MIWWIWRLRYVGRRFGVRWQLHHRLIMACVWATVAIVSLWLAHDTIQYMTHTPHCQQAGTC